MVHPPRPVLVCLAFAAVAGCATPSATAPGQAGRPGLESDAAARTAAESFAGGPRAHASHPGAASPAEARMLALVDRDRARHGRPPLAWDGRLAAIALAHDDDMIRRHYVAHVDPEGRGPADRLVAAGYLHRVVRENIAVAPTVAEAEVDLMHSPPHRRNLLASDVTRVGIGIRTVPVRGGGTEVVVTQDFAKPYTPPTARAARRAMLAAIDGFRRRAHQGSLPVIPVLQRLADTAVTHLAPNLAAAPLHDVAQAAADAIERGRLPGITGVTAATEDLLDLGDLRVPAPARSPDAVGLAVATMPVAGDDGQPRMLVLVLVGQGR